MAESSLVSLPLKTSANDAEEHKGSSELEEADRYFFVDF